jgi:hypothetical protein
MKIRLIFSIFFSLMISSIPKNLSGQVQPQEKSKDQTLIIDERDQRKIVEKIIEIDKVWAGHPVGFSLLTNNNIQYIAYYNADRHMVAGQRYLHENNFELYKLPIFDREQGNGTSTILGWDSHKDITMEIDNEGYIHLSGNMHVHPLTYFRSTQPEDISSLVQVKEMVGSNEKRCTYPKFMKTHDGDLIFHYRDGGSGDGNEIYNIYSSETQQWSRLLDSPLTDGQGFMNAYASQPEVREDNWYHMYWVWRDTPDCSTNHDLSYIKSPNMKKWYNAFGDVVDLPVTFDNKSVIVDPIPVQGGIINLAAKLCLDKDLKPLMAYHKYDQEGNLQFYVSRILNEQWVTKKITNWDYRWYFSGNGSISNEVIIGDFKKRKDGFFELGYQHIKYGSGIFLLDEDLNKVGEVLKPASFLANDNPEGNLPGLQIKTANDLGKSKKPGVRYMLKWETLPTNRDKPRPKPWPEPSQLYLYELHSSPH